MLRLDRRTVLHLGTRQVALADHDSSAGQWGRTRRTFTTTEYRMLRDLWPDAEVTVALLCRFFRCSSKLLVREVRALGLPLRKPQRGWDRAA